MEHRVQSQVTGSNSLGAQRLARVSSTNLLFIFISLRWIIFIFIIGYVK